MKAVQLDALEAPKGSPLAGPGHVTCATIVTLVALHSGYGERRLLGAERTHDLVRWRHIAMWLAREHAGKNSAQVGRAFDRDNTTVLHAWRSVEEMIAAQGRWAYWINKLNTIIRDGGAALS